MRPAQSANRGRSTSTVERFSVAWARVCTCGGCGLSCSLSRAVSGPSVAAEPGSTAQRYRADCCGCSRGLDHRCATAARPLAPSPCRPDRRHSVPFRIHRNFGRSCAMVGAPPISAGVYLGTVGTTHILGGVPSGFRLRCHPGPRWARIGSLVSPPRPGNSTIHNHRGLARGRLDVSCDRCPSCLLPWVDREPGAQLAVRNSFRWHSVVFVPGRRPWRWLVEACKDRGVGRRGRTFSRPVPFSAAGVVVEPFNASRSARLHDGTRNNGRRRDRRARDPLLRRFGNHLCFGLSSRARKRPGRWRCGDVRALEPDGRICNVFFLFLGSLRPRREHCARWCSSFFCGRRDERVATRRYRAPAAVPESDRARLPVLHNLLELRSRISWRLRFDAYPVPADRALGLRGNTRTTLFLGGDGRQCRCGGALVVGHRTVFALDQGSEPRSSSE